MSITYVASMLTMAWCVYLLIRMMLSNKASLWGKYLLILSYSSIVITIVLSILNMQIQYTDPEGMVVSMFQCLCMLLILIEGLIITRHT